MYHTYLWFALVTSASAQFGLSGVEYNTCSKSSFPKRIEFQTITVDDFAAAQQFYINILHAVPMDPFPVTFHGTSHYNAIFTAAERHSMVESLPDFSDEGDYYVQSQFLILGNGLLQLMSFEPHESRRRTWSLREATTSPCWIGTAHIDFWISDDWDMNDYIESVENQVKQTPRLQGKNVKWNRPVVQQARADFHSIPKAKFANKVPFEDPSNPFGGLEWSYFKGPVGEQLELYKITHTMKQHIGQAYCARGAVSSAFRNAADRPQKSLHGIFQHGFRTDNLHASVGFYTQVLGGHLIEYPVHGMDIRGDEAHWMILANETIQAIELAAETCLTLSHAMQQLGVANISSAGNNRLDHRFILFDNFVVEPLLYTNGRTFGGEGFNPKWSHPISPAYIGTISAAFGAPSALLPYLQTLQARAIREGFPSVQFPTESATFAESHPYFGLEYAYAKGPAGESLNYVQIQGPFAARMEQALLDSEGVSTAFFLHQYIRQR